MNEQEIIKIIQDELQKAQYGVSRVAFHVHNNIDSPQLKFIGLGDTPSTFSGQAGKVATVNPLETALIFSSVSGGYAGFVNADGTAGNLPSAWTSSKTGTGQYIVTHNLGTTNYSAVASASALSGFGALDSVNANDVHFKFLSAAGGGTLSDTVFYFIIVPF